MLAAIIIPIVVVVGIIILIFLIGIGLYNSIVSLRNRIDNAWSQIDVQLRKRYDLIPNLVETVKGYAKHEKGIMEKVTAARSMLMNAEGIVSKMKAGNVLSNAMGKLFAIAENYPQLKANENFLQLQTELAAIEDKIAYARQYYNDSIQSYNTLCTTFPGIMFASLYGKEQKEYLQLPEAQKAVPKISF